MLGFATTVPKGGDEQTLTGKASPVFGKPANSPAGTASTTDGEDSDYDPDEDE
jgi:hypothetical protein